MATPAKFHTPNFFTFDFSELSQTPAPLSRLVINCFFIQSSTPSIEEHSFEKIASELDPICPSVIAYKFPKSKRLEYAFYEFVHDRELITPPPAKKLRSERLREFSDVNLARNVSRFVSHLIYEMPEYLDQIISLLIIAGLFYKHCKKEYPLDAFVKYLQEMLPCIQILNETTIFIPNKETCVERFNPCHAN